MNKLDLSRCVGQVSITSAKVCEAIGSIGPVCSNQRMPPGILTKSTSNYHPDGWWDHVEWRCDDSQNVEKFGYFSKKGDVNPNWEGTNQRWEDGSMVGDNWMKPTVTVTGNYRFEFDAHL